MKAIAQIIAVS